MVGVNGFGGVRGGIGMGIGWERFRNQGLRLVGLVLVADRPHVQQFDECTVSMLTSHPRLVYSFGHVGQFAGHGFFCGSSLQSKWWMKQASPRRAL